MFFFISYIITCTYKTSLLISINYQYLAVLMCWGDLPRHRAGHMVLLFYSKLLFNFKNCGNVHWHIEGGGGQGVNSKGVVNSMSQTNKV